MAVLDDILGRRNYGQQAVDALRDKPKSLQEVPTSPALQPLFRQVEDAAMKKNALTYDEVAEQANPGSMTSPTAKLSPNVPLPGVVGRAQQQVAATQQQPAVQTATQQAADLQPQVSDLAGLTDAMERAKRALDEATETEEDKAAREKREKRQRLLATIGDGLGAFHEAYSYMRGINPMTSGSLSADQEARIRALGLERDKKYKDALDNYLAVLEMQRKNDYYNSIAETRKANQESQDRDRAERRKETARLNDAKVALYNARKGKLIDDSVFNAEYEQAITSGLDEATAINTALAAAKAHQEEQAKQKQAQSDAKVNATNAQANQRNAAASNSKAMAEKRRSGGSSGGAVTTTQDKTVYDKNGNVKGRTVTTTTKQPGRGSNKSSSKGNKGKGNNNGKKQTGLSGQWVK